MSLTLQEAAANAAGEAGGALADSFAGFQVDDAIDLAKTHGPKVIGALVALFVGWIIAGWIGRMVRNGLEKKNFDATLTRFFSQVARYVVLLSVVLGVLGVFGIQTSSFAAIIGAAGLAVGLAFQGTLGNFAAGMMLLVFRPFGVGDLVNTAGVLGICEDIGLFTCTFKTLDNRRIIVPNGKVAGEVIENIGAEDLRRVDIDVGTDYGADIDETRKLLEGAIKTIKGGLSDPAPQVFCASLGASSVDWQMRVWCNTEDYWDVWQETIRVTKKTLDDNGIGIPFPQMDVHLDGSVGK